MKSQSALAFLCASLGFQSFAAPVQPDAFQRKVEISFPGFTVENEVLQYFPMPIVIDPDAIKGFDYKECSPGGIVFADNAGNEIPHEVDRWDPSGKSYIWVRLPELKKDTTITMYYAPGSDVPRSTRPIDVWSEYVAVWHMNDPKLAGVRDSTGRGNDLVISPDHSTLAFTESAKFGSAVKFSAQNHGYIVNAVRDKINGAQSLSMEALFTTGNLGRAPKLVCARTEDKQLGDDAICLAWQLYGGKCRPQVQLRDDSGKRWFAMENTAEFKEAKSGDWGTASFCVSAANHSLVHYMNGFHNTDAAGNDFDVAGWSHVNLPTNVDLCVGMRMLDSKENQGWSGNIDELRISTSSRRSALWHTTFHDSLLAKDYTQFGEAQIVDPDAIFATCEVKPWCSSATFSYKILKANDTVIGIRVADNRKLTDATTATINPKEFPARGSISIQGLKPSTRYYAKLAIRDPQNPRRRRTVDMQFVTQDGVPELEPATFKVEPDGSIVANARLAKDSTTPVSIECYFGTDPEHLRRISKPVRSAVCEQTYSFDCLREADQDTPYYAKFRAVYGAGKEVWSEIGAFSTSPVKGILIYEDKFEQPLLFAERWRVIYGHIRPTLEPGSFSFPNAGPVELRQRPPKQFHAEMDFIIPPDTGAKHPARGGFGICGKSFEMDHTGHYFVFRGPAVPDFEFGKPVKMELTRRCKGEDSYEYIFRMNGQEFNRITASAKKPKDKGDDWDALKIWSYGLPYKVTHFAMWSLADDPRGPSPNYIANSSFESDYDGIPELVQRAEDYKASVLNSAEAYDHYLELSQVDKSVKHSGKQSLRLINDDYITLQRIFFHSSAPEGQDCVMSLWMRSDSDALPVTVAYGAKPQTFNVGREWARYELLAKGTDGHPMNRPRISFKDKGTLWVDDVQLEPIELDPNGIEETPKASEYRPSESDSLKVYFAKLKDSDVLPKPDIPKRRTDPVAKNRAQGKDIDGKPLKPVEVLGRLSFYMRESEAAFRLTVNVPIPARTKAVLECGGKKVIKFLKPAEELGSVVEMVLPIDSFADGTYPVSVELIAQNGESLAKGSGELRKLPYKDGATQINHFSRCIIHDGKPIVPVALFLDGLHHPVTASSNAVAWKLDLYKNYGIKTGHALFPFNEGSDGGESTKYGKPNVAGPREFMDGTARRGMYSIPWCEAIFYSETKQKELMEWINRQTNVLAHMVLDEPEIHRNYTGDQAAEYVRKMRTLDPYHPMFMNQAFFGIPNNYAGRESDIFMIDDYLTNNHQMRSVASVVDNAIDMWNYGVEKGVPVWFFLVGANMQLHGREPSYAQQIAQTYGCVAAGCSGFSYFYGTMKTPGNWKAVRQIAEEMEALTPAIASEEHCAATVSDVDDASLRIRTMRHDGAIYIATCNVEDKALGDVELTLPQECASAKHAEVLFENRTIKIKNGILRDTFPRWTRHVYKIAVSE